MHNPRAGADRKERARWWGKRKWSRLAHAQHTELVTESECVTSCIGMLAIVGAIGWVLLSLCRQWRYLHCPHKKPTEFIWKNTTSYTYEYIIIRPVCLRNVVRKVGQRGLHKGNRRWFRTGSTSRVANMIGPSRCLAAHHLGTWLTQVPKTGICKVCGPLLHTHNMKIRSQFQTVYK